MFIYNPLEQFSVLPFFNLTIGAVDLSFTNSSLYCLLTLGSIALVWSLVLHKGGFLVPPSYQVVVEVIYRFLISLAHEQVGKRSKCYEAIIMATFWYILTANLLGLIPFGFATTAQLVVAFGLSFSLFIGVTLIGVMTNKVNFLSLFLPSGAPFELAPLLVVIELTSYVFRPISLGVRLFANMTAGHSLLAIIAGFGWSIGTSGSVFAVFGLAPAMILLMIFVLELAVAFLQSYVFVVLLGVYLKDAIELH
jgi:F-type H+-transporting ATPase subunit a